MNKNTQPNYLLMTPGPLSTSPTVRQAMCYDSCTWDQDYKGIVTEIREQLLAIANCDASRYTTVLMQGSGSFGVESVLGSSVNRKQHKLLLLTNGVYGKRMVEMVKILELPHHVYEVPENEIFVGEEVGSILEQDPAISHLAMVHCETTTGILNALHEVAALAKQYKKYFIVDAMSSFGGIEIDMVGLNIDFLISSANKCIQGVPGFSFVICKKESLLSLCKQQAKSLCLDLYGQWDEMEKDPGKWRYTSPTHAVLAFHQALRELHEEGGLAVRAARYRENQRLLTEKMAAFGFHAYIAKLLQSPIITTFLQPNLVPNTKQPFVFTEFYSYLKNYGFVIYPGKISNQNTFRIGSIGHLFKQDMERFLSQVTMFIETVKKNCELPSDRVCAS